MDKISDEAMRQVFTEARTHRAWLPEGVEQGLLRELYDLMKMGPTSGNCCPARIVFVKGAAAKEKLIACTAAGNVAKVKAAPVTAIVAFDEKFYEFMPKLNPIGNLQQVFAQDAELARVTAFRNGTLEGGYFILAARALGLDTGPMSGFDNAKLDEAFFAGTSWKSNFICNIGYGDKSKLHPRQARLSFEEAARIE